ncbi:hypothetical protein PILCRDRAFT_813117 [Piloderma croceum F 1598]|uniref:Uncharacterized protein n=1 Tax=Piloderma croceum (strain F 1598) TaxID=765440 RepID=A0A0C3GBU6_PILCF|nr:hypothetical protein PILCRDRAFT_813117 [Piloderma croceum F 1598]
MNKKILVKEVDGLTFFYTVNCHSMKDRSSDKPRVNRDPQSTSKTTRRANNCGSSLSKALSGSEVPRIFQLTEDPPNQKNH